MTRNRLALAACTLILLVGQVSAKPDKGSYPFAMPADKALEKLADFDKVSGKKLPIAKDESALFADAKDGKLDTTSFAEACLLASGVTDTAQRKTYLAKIDSIEAAARKELESAKTPRDKGERLLKFLHASAMANGYESQQTDLHTVLDTGKFNCVSSAVLYNVIGRRLGLDLRAVEIPEHVFSVLYDGDQQIDVETTNARGFDLSDDSSSVKKVTKAQRHADHRREVGEAGLAAVIAYNHGVSQSRDKQFQAAAMSNYRALALDATNPSAAKNALADMTNWPLELSKAGEYEHALAVMAISLQLAPTEAGLKNNHKVIWSDYAEARMNAGKTDEAIAVLRRAAKAGTGEDFESRQAYLFAKPAHELMDQGKWQEALAKIDAGIKVVDPKAQKKLRDTRVGLFLNWSNEESKKERFAEALDVLKRAAAEEKDSRIKNNTLATYDSWADRHMQKGEWAEAIKIYETGLQHLPGDGHLQQNLTYCKAQLKK